MKTCKFDARNFSSKKQIFINLFEYVSETLVLIIENYFSSFSFSSLFGKASSKIVGLCSFCLNAVYSCELAKYFNYPLYKTPLHWPQLYICASTFFTSYLYSFSEVMQIIHFFWCYLGNLY